MSCGMSYFWLLCRPCITQESFAAPSYLKVLYKLCTKATALQLIVQLVGQLFGLWLLLAFFGFFRLSIQYFRVPFLRENTLHCCFATATLPPTRLAVHASVFSVPLPVSAFCDTPFLGTLLLVHRFWCTALAHRSWCAALGALLLVRCFGTPLLVHRSWCTALGAPLLARHFLAQFSPVDCTLFQAFLQFTTITIKRSFLTHFLRHMHFFCVRSYPLLYPPPAFFVNSAQTSQPPLGGG